MSCKHEHEGATPSRSTKAAGSAPRRSTSSVRKREAFDSRSQLSRVSDVQRQHAWLPTKTYGSDSRGTLQAVVRPVTARGCQSRYEGSTPFGRSDPSTNNVSLCRGGLPRTGLRSPLSRFDSERRGPRPILTDSSLPVHASLTVEGGRSAGSLGWCLSPSAATRSSERLAPC